MDEMIGEWIILKDEEIIEHNRDVKIILELAEKYKDEKIIISKIPSSEYCYY